MLALYHYHIYQIQSVPFVFDDVKYLNQQTVKDMTWQLKV